MIYFSTLIRWALLLCSALLLFACTADSGKQADSGGERIILAHAMHPSHPVSVALERMASNAGRLSDGQLNIQIYAGGQLGSERELLELIQLGSIGMTKVSAATIENVVPAMQVYSLPYLFRNEAHVRQVQDGPLGRELLREGIPKRLRGMAYYDAGSRSIYTVNRRVERPEDMNGLKIRVMESRISVRLMRSLGGAPTPISWGELYTAFQGGLVDGAENNPPSFYTSRHYEVCRYYVLNEHATIPDLLVMDERLWQRLSTQQQQWLREAIDESVAFQRELWQEFTENALMEIEAAGVEIIRPDRQPFREATRPLYEHIAGNEPELHAWVTRILAID